ncbi:MAG: integration host factor subunit beta [Gammaproteobacteria bacterium]|nr:MAG: integration host factor subunit beta [Gammaproteobacteria bacterium]
MTKTGLVNSITEKQKYLDHSDIDIACNLILKYIGDSLIKKDRIEIRGFGSFAVHHHKAKVGRNPKTGESVDLDEKFVPFFRPGKKLKQMVNDK